VYRLDEHRALVATTDFFTPIVDNPYDFGRIAAANALSDVYAMGARPLFALNLVAFPRNLLSAGILDEIMRGGADIARTAGIPIVGGHSIEDAEPKYGLCVIGEIDPDRIVRNVGAQVGDALVLTKPIGTGIIATAIKNDCADEDVISAAVHSMTTLNREASSGMLRISVHAATDVTGFGLLGHLHEMLRGSGVGAVINASAVPVLNGAEALAKAEQIPGGTRRNFADAAAYTEWGNAIPEWQQLLLCDAQTSGGLLIACPSSDASQLKGAVIGSVIAGESVIKVDS
jgi:selenide, water dikinase